MIINFCWLLIIKSVVDLPHFFVVCCSLGGFAAQIRSDSEASALQDAKRSRSAYRSPTERSARNANVAHCVVVKCKLAQHIPSKTAGGENY